MNAIHFLPLITAVSWTTVVGVGSTGLVLAPREVPPLRAMVPLAAPVQKLEVTLTVNADGSPEPDQAPEVSESAVINQVLNDAPPAAPAMSAMAAGSPVAFAIPVAAPAAIVGKSSAASMISPGVPGGVPGGVVGGVPVTKITRGKGFGRGLPAPAYPEEARLNGWEGSVTVRFAIDGAGRVMVAKVVSSSGRSVLDSEALETVRARWQFPAGSPPGPFDWTAHFVLE